jgi:prevent-host-death family protein
MEATMHEAETNLSELVKRAQSGEEVIITSGRSRRPVARVVALSKQKPKGRTPGLFKGKVSIGPEFHEPLSDEELELWYGKTQ